MSELHTTVAPQWKLLGVFLNLDSSFLRVIEMDNPQNTKVCLMEMLQYWQQHDPQPSWSTLVKALRELGEEKLGENIKEKYCILD